MRRRAARHAPAAAAACSCRRYLPPAAPPRAPAHRRLVHCHTQASLKKKEAELELVAPYSRSYGRTLVKSVLEGESEGLSLVGAAAIGGAAAALWIAPGADDLRRCGNR